MSVKFESTALNRPHLLLLLLLLPPVLRPHLLQQPRRRLRQPREVAAGLGRPAHVSQDLLEGEEPGGNNRSFVSSIKARQLWQGRRNFSSCFSLVIKKKCYYAWTTINCCLGTPRIFPPAVMSKNVWSAMATKECVCESIGTRDLGTALLSLLYLLDRLIIN